MRERGWGEPGEPRYRPIESYGLIGDLRTAALVGRDGAIDWFCPKRFDAPSLFATILDADIGGSFRIAPEVPCASKQLYLPDTAILLTRFFSGRSPSAWPAGGICAAPAHGTAVVEGGEVRYTPAPGFSGADSFTYSTGGACGTVTLTVQTSAAPAPAPAAAFVVLTAPARRAALASGALRISQRLRIDHPGRCTFIYTDPVTGRRVRQLPGSRIGARRLGRRYGAPVLVTTRAGAGVTLVSVFSRRRPAALRKRIVLRIVLKGPDGMLSDVTP